MPDFLPDFLFYIGRNKSIWRVEIIHICPLIFCSLEHSHYVSVLTFNDNPTALLIANYGNWNQADI